MILELICEKKYMRPENSHFCKKTILGFQLYKGTFFKFVAPLGETDSYLPKF